MPTDRFLIQFDTNYRSAVAALDILGRKVAEIERRINSLNQRTGGAAGPTATFTAMGSAATAAGQSVGNLGNSIRASFNIADKSLFATKKNAKALRSEIASFERDRRTFARSGTVMPDAPILAAIRNYEKLGATGTKSISSIRAAQERLAKDLSDPNKFFPQGLGLGLNKAAGEVRRFSAELNAVERGIGRRQLFGKLPTESQLGRGLQASLALQERGFAGASASVQKYTSALERGKFVADDASRSFGFHARRIAEGIFIYEAFAQAVNAAVQAVGFVANTDREIARLSAVLGGLSDSDADAFMASLGQIAIDTNTPMQDLVGTTDLLAGTLADLEGDVLTNVEAFQRLAGEFTNVLGAGTNQEAVTGQLSQIFKALDFKSVDEFQQFLDFLVTSGHKSAFEIENIFNALAEVAPNAQAAGLDVNLLALALDNLIRTNSGAQGGELGNIFKTALGRFLKPSDQEDIQEVFDDISGGFLQIKDASGNVKPATQVFLELVAAFKQGAISGADADKVFAQLVGQLAPGQVGIVTNIFEAFVDAVDRGPAVFRESKDALKELSDFLVDTLAGRFGQFVRRLEAGLTESRHAIEEFLNTLLGVGEGFLDLAGFLGADFFVVLAKLSLLLAGLKLIGIVRDLALVRAAWAGLTTIGVALNLVIGTMAATSGGLGAKLAAGAGGVRILTGALVSLSAVASTLLPVLLAIAAIQIGGALIDRGQRSDALLNAGFSEREVFEGQGGRRGQTPTNPGVGSFGRFGPGTEAAPTDLTAEQITNLDRLAQALVAADEAGTLTAVSQERMKNAILSADGTVKTYTVSIDDINAATTETGVTTTSANATFVQYFGTLERTTEAQNKLTEATHQANEIERLNNQLASERVAAIEQLDERLSSGDITQRQYAAGVEQVRNASELAARASVILGDSLGRIPQLEAAAKGGADELSQALFNQILQSGNNSVAIEHMISRLIALSQAIATAAQIAASSPIIIKTATLDISSSFAHDNPEVHTAIGIAQNQVNAFNLVNTLTARFDQILSNLGTSFSNNANSLLGTGAGSGGGSGGGGGTKATKPARPQTPIVDIGALSPRQIHSIIDIAEHIRNRVPGGRAESKGDVVSLLRDGRFLRNLHGIDERFLRIAIDRLTKQMEHANELAERRREGNKLLSNLVVNQGPLGALISQPTAFGVAGSLAAGNGLNFNPAKGNFVINVPVELQGLRPAALQQLIYNIISRAIRDALRI